MKKLKVFFTAITLLVGTLAFAQNIQVKNATTGEAVPYAVITLI